MPIPTSLTEPPPRLPWRRTIGSVALAWVGVAVAVLVDAWTGGWSTVSWVPAVFTAVFVPLGIIGAGLSRRT